MRCLFSARRLAVWVVAFSSLALGHRGAAWANGPDHLAIGQDHFFNHEYGLAAHSFRQFREREPTNPTAHVLLAKALLYQELHRLGMISTSAFRDDGHYNSGDKPKPEESAVARILLTLREGQALCKRRLEADGSDVWALNGLAQLHAVRANHELMVEKAYFKALANGRRGRALSYRVGRLRPEFVDGLLVAGLAEYLLGSLPWALRALIALSGYRGSKKKGAELIARVATEGTENRNDARALLAMLHQRERRPLEAARVFRSLAEDFPRAYTYRLEVAAMHMAAGQRQAALEIFREVERKRASGEDRYDRMPRRLAAALARRIEGLERALEEDR